MSPWWTRTAVKRKRYCEVLERGEKKVKLLHEVKWNRSIPHKACMRVSTCSHKWGWVVSSVLVSVERWRETFHWTVAYCCYSVLNLKKKLKFNLKHWKKNITVCVYSRNNNNKINYYYYYYIKIVKGIQGYYIDFTDEILSGISSYSQM